MQSDLPAVLSKVRDALSKMTTGEWRITDRDDPRQNPTIGTDDIPSVAVVWDSNANRGSHPGKGIDAEGICILRNNVEQLVQECELKEDWRQHAKDCKELAHEFKKQRDARVAEVERLHTEIRELPMNGQMEGAREQWSNALDREKCARADAAKGRKLVLELWEKMPEGSIDRLQDWANASE